MYEIFKKDWICSIRDKETWKVVEENCNKIIEDIWFQMLSALIANYEWDNLIEELRKVIDTVTVFVADIKEKQVEEDFKEDFVNEWFSTLESIKQRHWISFDLSQSDEDIEKLWVKKTLITLARRFKEEVIKDERQTWVWISEKVWHSDVFFYRKFHENTYSKEYFTWTSFVENFLD